MKSLCRFLSTEKSEQISFGSVGPYVSFMPLLDDKDPLESMIKCRTPDPGIEDFDSVFLGGDGRRDKYHLIHLSYQG